MVFRHTLIWIIAFLWIQANAQTFDYDLDVNVEFVLHQDAVELNDHKTASTFHTPIESSQFRLLITKENGDKLDYWDFQIMDENYEGNYGRMIEEWSDSNSLKGIMVATDVSDDTRKLVSWEYDFQSFQITPFSEINLVADGWAINNYTFHEQVNHTLLFMSKPISVDSVSMKMITMDQALNIVSQDSFNFISDYYVTDFEVIDNKLVVNHLDGFSFFRDLTDLKTIIDTIKSNKITPEVSDTIGFLSYSCHRMINNRLLLFGKNYIDRDPDVLKDEEDYELEILKLSSSGEHLDTFFFGQLDTLNEFSNSGHVDDEMGRKCIDESEDGSLFVSSFSNELSLDETKVHIWFNIQKLDSSLNPIWRYTWEDDFVFYHNYLVLPMSDGGAMTFSFKEDLLSSSSEMVIHVLRVKPNGEIYTLNVPQPKSKSDITLYPNPATDRFSISGLPDDMQSIDLIDINGRTVRSYGGRQESYAVEGLPAGVYVVKVETSKGLETIKLIKGE